MIPEAAVEAAAKAHFENGWGDAMRWERAGVEEKSEALDDMRAALEAAAPFIAAQALEHAADYYRHDEHPNARLYLRHRADQIRASGV